MSRRLRQRARVPAAAVVARLAWATCLCMGLLCAQDTWRIGVFGLFRPRQLSVTAAPGQILQVEAGGRRLFLEAGQTALLQWVDGEIFCQSPQELLLHGQQVRVSARGGAATQLLLNVPQQIERRFTGVLEVAAVAGQLEPVLVMNREDAVAAAVAAESPPQAGVEALRAQAVVTRSYYTASRGRHDRFDFCDTTHCQFLREVPLAASAVRRAASDTRGQVLKLDGEAFPALFTGSCGGHTRTPGEVGLRDISRGFTAVPCAACERSAKRWESVLDATQAAPLLGAPNHESARLQVGRLLGWSTVPSNTYTIEQADSKVRLVGRGEGHGIGLCQLGAAAMAAQGLDARAILRHYFPQLSF